MGELTYQQICDRPYSSVETLWHLGIISDATWRRFRIEWRWCAPRLSDPKHDLAYERLGRVGYWRRIERARRRCGLAPLRNLSAICPEAVTQ